MKTLWTLRTETKVRDTSNHWKKNQEKKKEGETMREISQWVEQCQDCNQMGQDNQELYFHVKKKNE